MRSFLDDGVLSIIARVAAAPVPRAEIAPGIVAELVEMHVLEEQDGLVRLGTCVFLEEDLKRINAFALTFAEELTGPVMAAAARGGGGRPLYPAGHSPRRDD